jgi:DNA-binding transcriptional regulator YiaG
MPKFLVSRAGRTYETTLLSGERTGLFSDALREWNVTARNAKAASALRDVLQQLGLTQDEFSRLLRVSKTTVQFWCSGERPVPGYAVAYLDLFSDRQKAIEALRPFADAGIHYEASGINPHETLREPIGLRVRHLIQAYHIFTTLKGIEQ